MGFQVPRLKGAADDNEEITRRQAAHEDADQALNRSEHSPRLRRHKISITNGRLGDSRDVGRSFGIGHASAPKIEQRPDGNLGEMDQD